jgi:hypothetical protein
VAIIVDSLAPDPHMNFFRLGIGITCALALSASRASAQAMGQPVNGISCDAQEGQRIHIHQHLAIFDHGKEMTVPQFIGIPQASRCIYWLHTHTPDGIIHVEAPRDRSFALGDFFAVWGQPLDRTHAASATTRKRESMRVFLNGVRYTGNPAQIPLTAHADIVIEVGPPFTKPARFTNWGAL